MITGSAGGADIYLDQDQPRNRFRFTCAHEIGHYVDRLPDLQSGKAFVDRRSDTDRGTAVEIYANEFAGSLLMPERELLQAVASGLGRYELSDRAWCLAGCPRVSDATPRPGLSSPEDPQVEALADSEIPPTSEAPPKASATEAVQSAHEIYQESAIDQAGQVGGKAIASFLYIHPFTSLFCHLADRHLRESHPEARVRLYREQARGFWRFCVICDYILLAVVVLALLAASLVALYKTLWLGAPPPTP